MARRAHDKDKSLLGFFKNKMKIKKRGGAGRKLVLTLSLARKVKNLGNSLCVKEGGNVSVFHGYDSLGINSHASRRPFLENMLLT